jgi:NADH-quinone oxidoreductase subunit M
VVSVVYGALVALGQSDFKRMIAYTSVNHMGYIVLAVGAAGLVAGTAAQARQLAITGAVTQMVSHGLITGALFLLSGVLYERGGTYDMGSYGGLARSTPMFAGLTAVAAFASLGLPGFSGFIAEFQVFLGSLGPAPAATAVAVLGVLITAALLLWALQRVFLGEAPAGLRTVPDLRGHELAATAPLLAAALVIGVFPRFLLDLIEPASRAVVTLVAR